MPRELGEQMYIEAESLDDLLRKTFGRLLKSKNRPTPTKGTNREAIGALLKIKDPRARLSRTERRATLFSCLGETLWYLAGSNLLDVIEYYIPNYRKFSKLRANARVAPGAYGPRLFGAGRGINQVQRVIEMLSCPERHDTRQAVIQIFDKSDLGKKDVPCTCNLQFLARGNALHLYITMRSNDAYLGLPHDIFAFTMLQEIIARSIGHEVGTYNHAVGSLHLYEANKPQVFQYLAEGWQDKIAMPPMPVGDPWPALAWLKTAEAMIRYGSRSLPSHNGIDPYWVDLARILLIKALLNDKDARGVVREKNAMSSPIYYAFIRGRERALMVREARQFSFPAIGTSR